MMESPTTKELKKLAADFASTNQRIDRWCEWLVRMMQNAAPEGVTLMEILRDIDPTIPPGPLHRYHPLVRLAHTMIERHNLNRELTRKGYQRRGAKRNG